MGDMDSFVTSLVDIVAAVAVVLGSFAPVASEPARWVAREPQIVIPLCGSVQVVVQLDHVAHGPE
jgi:hypothetical protein